MFENTSERKKEASGQGWIKTVSVPKILKLANTLATVQRRAPVLALTPGQSDLQATYPINPMTTTPKTSQRHGAERWATPALGANADDPRYPSPTGDPRPIPRPLNRTPSPWEQVGRAAGQSERHSEGASSLRCQGSSPRPEGLSGRTRLRVKRGQMQIRWCCSRVIG